MKPSTLSLLVTLVFSTHGYSDPADGPQFDQLSWLNGCWKGAGLGGEVEECWMSSPDQKMTSMFQMTMNGKQQFSEIVMIAEFDGVFAMRVKHFDKSFEQWDSDKGTGVTFPFVEQGDNFIQFKGLRYELTGGQLQVTLDMKQGEEIHRELFIYHRN